MNQSVSLELHNLSVNFQQRQVLQDITANIESGKITAVIGPNGSGKTTLLRAILGQITYQGNIRFSGANGTAMQPVIAYVPQRFERHQDLPVSVTDFLLLDVQSRPLWLGSQRQHLEQVMESLKRVGAERLASLTLATLSGGELQRVLLAKALLRRPNLILLDEPVAGVDIAGEALFCDLLEELQKSENFTLIMVSHDLSVVSHHAHMVLCLNRHLICHGKVTEVITTDTIQKLYGVHMGFHRHD